MPWCILITCHMASFKSSWGQQVPCCNFFPLRTHLVDPSKKSLSRSFNVVIYYLLVTLIVIVKFQSIIFIIWHVVRMEKICIHSNNLSDMYWILTSNSIKIEIFIWFHIFSSLYIVIFIGFFLECIYFSALWHAQNVDNNPVIKVDCNSRNLYIVGRSAKLLQQHFHGLDGPELASKE